MAVQPDKYANIIVQRVTMSAANTITFQEVQVGFSLFERLGVLIHRIEYYPTTTTVQMIEADADLLAFGVTANDTLTSFDPSNPAVIDLVTTYAVASGAPATLVMPQYPIVKDLSSLPSGGLIITPRPWYIGMDSASLTGAGAGWVRFFFTVLKLKDSDYFELLETRHYFG